MPLNPQSFMLRPRECLKDHNRKCWQDCVLENLGCFIESLGNQRKQFSTKSVGPKDKRNISTFLGLVKTLAHPNEKDS